MRLHRLNPRPIHGPYRSRDNCATQSELVQAFNARLYWREIFAPASPREHRTPNIQCAVDWMIDVGCRMFTLDGSGVQCANFLGRIPPAGEGGKYTCWELNMDRLAQECLQFSAAAFRKSISAIAIVRQKSSRRAAPQGSRSGLQLPHLTKTYWLGAGFCSRKNPVGETCPPTVPSVVGRVALGIKVHFSVFPIRCGLLIVTPVPVP